MKIVPQGKKGWILFFVRWTIIILILAAITAFSVSMPGESYHSNLPALSKREANVRDHLRIHVQKLAGEIGERNVENSRALKAAADYIEESWSELGLKVNKQRYAVTDGLVYNIEGEMAGSRLGDEIIIVGAHYDSVPDSRAPTTMHPALRRSSRPSVFFVSGIYRGPCGSSPSRMKSHPFSRRMKWEALFMRHDAGCVVKKSLLCYLWKPSAVIPTSPVARSICPHSTSFIPLPGTSSALSAT